MTAFNYKLHDAHLNAHRPNYHLCSGVVDALSGAKRSALEKRLGRLLEHEGEAVGVLIGPPGVSAYANAPAPFMATGQWYRHAALSLSSRQDVGTLSIFDHATGKEQKSLLSLSDSIKAFEAETGLELAPQVLIDAGFNGLVLKVITRFGVQSFKSNMPPAGACISRLKELGGWVTYKSDGERLMRAEDLNLGLPGTDIPRLEMHTEFRGADWAFTKVTQPGEDINAAPFALDALIREVQEHLQREHINEAKREAHLTERMRTA